MLSDAWHLKSREDHRFWQLTSGVWVAALTGVLYAFGVISDDIKERFGFSQEDLTTISTVGFVSCIFGFSGGFTWDKWGATPVLICSALMISSSFIILGLTFDGYIPVSIPLLSFSQAIAALGIVWGDVGSLMTNMMNFPLNQGSMVLIQKTWMGLGGTVFAVMYIGWFNHQPDVYCYFVAFIILAGYLPAILWLNVPKMEMIEKRRILGHSWSGSNVSTEEELKEAEEQREFLLSVPADQRRLNVGYGILGFMLVFLVSATSVNAVYDIPPTTSAMFGVCAVSVIVLGYGSMAFLPFTNPMANRHRFSHRRTLSTVHDGSTPPPAGGGNLTALSENVPTVPYSPCSIAPAATNRRAANASGGSDQAFSDGGSSNNLATAGSAGESDREGGGANSGPAASNSTSSSGGGRKYDTSFYESIKHPDIWLLWWASFCMWGSGKTLALNCAQIYRAVNNDVFDSSTNALYVAMVGVGGALGRMVVGLVDQKLINPPQAPGKKGSKAKDPHKEWNTTHLYPPCALLLVAGCLLFLVVGPSGLALPFVITAAGYGCSWAATVLLVPQMFSKDLGKHYNFLFSSMISIIFLNRGLFGTSFAAEAVKQGKGTRCSGHICIQTPMLVMALLNCTALVTCVIVHRRWRKFRAGGSDHSSSELL